MPGPYAVRVSRYDRGDEALALPVLGDAPVEIRAVVTAPVGARGRLSLVLVLYGQHPSC